GGRGGRDRARPHRRDGASPRPARRRPGERSPRMTTAGGWICLASPLAGAVAITMAGGRISRRTAGWISTLTTFLAFSGALLAFIGLWAADPSDREQVSTAYTWLAAGDFPVSVPIR